MIIGFIYNECICERFYANLINKLIDFNYKEEEILIKKIPDKPYYCSFKRYYEKHLKDCKIIICSADELGYKICNYYILNKLTNVRIIPMSIYPEYKPEYWDILDDNFYIHNKNLHIRPVEHYIYKHSVEGFVYTNKNYDGFITCDNKGYYVYTLQEPSKMPPYDARYKIGENGSLIQIE